jgi:hypothetical protein
MQGTGHADVQLYFKCPVTRQMGCPVNVYDFIIAADIVRFLGNGKITPF